MHRDVDSAVQRLRAHVLLSWEKEARTLAGCVAKTLKEQKTP